MDTTETILSSWAGDRALNVKTWSHDKTFHASLKDSFVGKAARKTASRKLAALVKDYEHYKNIAIADTKGNLIASADPSHIGAVNISDRSYFKTAIQGKETA